MPRRRDSEGPIWITLALSLAGLIFWPNLKRWIWKEER